MDSPRRLSTKRRLSRRSGSPSQLVSATGAKRIKEEILSKNEASMAVLPEIEHLGLSDDEDVYIPPAMANPYTSEAESQAEDDDGDGDESDGGLRALVSRAKQARAEPGKWDADVKRARWNEKYASMDVEEAVGKFFLISHLTFIPLISFSQLLCPRSGAPTPTPTSSTPRL